MEISEDTQSQLKTMSPSKLIRKVEANFEFDAFLQKGDDKNQDPKKPWDWEDKYKPLREQKKLVPLPDYIRTPQLNTIKKIQSITPNKTRAPLNPLNYNLKLNQRQSSILRSDKYR